MSEQQPGDRAMFWFNVVGIGAATLLLGAFVFFFGTDFFSLIWVLLHGGPDWHDR